MNFIKRGLTSIARRKSKSIILLILIFILGNVIAGAISIEQAVKNTEKNIRNQIGGIATVEVDYNKIPQDPNFDYETIEYISADAINKIGQLPYVKDYDYITQTGLETAELKHYRNEDSTNVTMGLSSVMQSYYNNMFWVKAVKHLDVLDFKQGNGSIVEGRTFREEDTKDEKNPIIITQKLAELNNLNVGSVITLEANIREINMLREGQIEDSHFEVQKNNKFEFQVIGIYEPKKIVSSDGKGGMDFSYQDEEKQNQMYITSVTAERIQKVLLEGYKELSPETAESYAKEYITPIFILNDPLDLDMFKEEVTPMLPEYYGIVDSSSVFDSIAAPMKNIEWIAGIVLYVALGATLLILSLLITLFLRDRKYEMGIYLALGEKKTKVMGQIVIEVLLIAIIGITLSLFSGNIIAGSMSEKMLNNQMIADGENGMVYYGGTLQWLGYGADITPEQIMENYKVSIGLSTILMFYGIGLATVLVSTTIPNLYILRLNPKKIMM